MALMSRSIGYEVGHAAGGFVADHARALVVGGLLVVMVLLAWLVTRAEAAWKSRRR
jgi:hypothetical protein